MRFTRTTLRARRALAPGRKQQNLSRTANGQPTTSCLRLVIALSIQVRTLACLDVARPDGSKNRTSRNWETSFALRCPAGLLRLLAIGKLTERPSSLKTAPFLGGYMCRTGIRSASEELKRLKWGCWSVPPA